MKQFSLDTQTKGVLVRAMVSAVFFLSATFALAQTTADVSVSVYPESPAPYDNVTISLISYSVDLDRATIVWNTGGKTALSGIGKKVFSLTVGGAGAESRVSIRITSGANTIGKTITIAPGSVDLLWEASASYTPPFYRGKALPSPEATIKVVAIPSLGSASPKANTLVYRWERNNQAYQDASGYGKNVYKFKNSYLDQEEVVTVSVSSINGSLGGKGIAGIGIVSPVILLYEDDPLRGIIYNNALGGSFPMKNAEVRVTAEPYFFSAGEKQSGELSYSWQLNNSDVPGAPDDASSIILRSGGESGTADISISIKAVKKILQSASNSLSVNFGMR